MKLRWLIILLLPGVILGQDDTWDDDTWKNAWGDDEVARIWSGFVDGGLGTRIDTDERVGQRNTLEDLRARFEAAWHPDGYTLTLKADVGYDGIEDGWVADLRDLSLKFSPGTATDISIGRQVHTWGTGDLVFINDLFPKDFVSFFAGRDDEYLKAPANSLRVTHFANTVNVDLVWVPVFEPDLYLTGERFSFFSPMAAMLVAPDPPLRAVEPGTGIDNSEVALRLFKTVAGTEYALYGYRGFSKQPVALTPELDPAFERLRSYGASLRRPAGPGLFNAEIAWYNTGTDQARLLAGYEWEAKPNFSVGLQYYVEATSENKRHLLTNRLTYRTGMDRFTWSLFTFYSPSDNDYYLRPQFNYRHSDRWSVTTGANLFGGDADDTFFGQLRDASNAYLRVRFHY